VWQLYIKRASSIFGDVVDDDVVDDVVDVVHVVHVVDVDAVDVC
jgi:hypothetical protein